MGACFLEAAEILSRVGRGSDLVFFAATALLVRDQYASHFFRQRMRSVKSSSREGGAVAAAAAAVTAAVVVLASGTCRFPALSAIICAPPVAHVAFAAASRNARYLFEPFGGGPLFSALQGCGWTMYGALCVDATLLASCVLPTDSRIASTFGLRRAATLGALGAAAHLALFSSLAVREPRSPARAVARECAWVACALVGATGVGVAVCLDVDPAETADIFAAIFNVGAVPRFVPRAVAFVGAVLAPLVLLLGRRPPFTTTARARRYGIASVLSWLVGVVATRTFVAPRAVALCVSLLLALRTQLPPAHSSFDDDDDDDDDQRKVPDPNDLCVLVFAAAAATRDDDDDDGGDVSFRRRCRRRRRPWNPSLTFAVAEFLLGDRPPAIQTKK